MYREAGIIIKANFNLEKEARKALVKALGEVTGQEPAYQGAPSFAFAVGSYTVDRYGSINFGEADCLRFPWFKPEASAAETDAYSRLIAGLCETAKKKQRVTATERRLKDGDNEKFK